jgi:peptide chain release factor 2
VRGARVPRAPPGTRAPSGRRSTRRPRRFTVPSSGSAISRARWSSGERRGDLAAADRDLRRGELDDLGLGHDLRGALVDAVGEVEDRLGAGVDALGHPDRLAAAGLDLAGDLDRLAELLLDRVGPVLQRRQPRADVPRGQRDVVQVVERADEQAGREQQGVPHGVRVPSTPMSAAPDDTPIPQRLAAIRDAWEANRQGVDVDALAADVSQFEAEMQDPAFWDDPAAAQKTSAEHARVARRLERFRSLEADVADLEGLAELAAEDPEILAELQGQLATMEAKLVELEEERLFSGTYDAGDALVTVNAGAGGTDAQDWAEMVLRMEMRWAEKRGFKVELLEASDGEEAGIKSATFRASGENAYGLFGAEKGVHRLVRLSPFDSANRRQTSFAGLEVAPVIEDVGEVEINDDDLRVDTYRASGAGGQHVNKTDSAVRITHRPTGIVVQCQNERSQSANKDTAMKMLYGKLVERRRPSARPSWPRRRATPRT